MPSGESVRHVDSDLMKAGGQGRPTRLAILVPSGDKWEADFALSMLTLTRYITYKPVCQDFDYMILNERGSLITLQRESMVHTALENEDVTHFLWLDSDMSFPPDLFHRLLSHDLPLVACNYVKRGIPATPNSKDVDGKVIATNRDSRGLEEADSAGFGALLVKREVFENTERPWFDTVWFTTPEGKLEMMGEDVFFFRKARRTAGYPLFIDHSLSQKIGHVGSYTYENWMCQSTLDAIADEGFENLVMSK